MLFWSPIIWTKCPDDDVKFGLKFLLSMCTRSSCYDFQLVCGWDYKAAGDIVS